MCCYILLWDVFAEIQFAVATISVSRIATSSEYAPAKPQKKAMTNIKGNPHFFLIIFNNLTFSIGSEGVITQNQSIIDRYHRHKIRACWTSREVYTLPTAIYPIPQEQRHPPQSFFVMTTKQLLSKPAVKQHQPHMQLENNWAKLNERMLCKTHIPLVCKKCIRQISSMK